MNYPYETLAYVARLQFKDAYGLEAWFHWYQRIRVLTEELYTLNQEVWGQGDPLFLLNSSTADLVHTQTDGNKQVLLSALRRPAKKNDILEIHSIRAIHHGFKDSDEFWEEVPLMPTESLRVSIDFPVAREPLGLSVSKSGSASQTDVRRPGTKQLVLSAHNVAPRTIFRTDWSW